MLHGPCAVTLAFLEILCPTRPKPPPPCRYRPCNSALPRLYISLLSLFVYRISGVEDHFLELIVSPGASLWLFYYVVDTTNPPTQA